MKNNVIKEYAQKSISFIWEVVKVVAISLAIILPIRYFLVQPFYVKGSSMEPNFYDYEYLVIDVLDYRLHSPERGEVVVLYDPRDSSQFFIKRVVALPGETVSFRNGKVLVDGVELDEPYLGESSETVSEFGQQTTTVEEGQYYVMGDNRSASYDSRRFGGVEESEFVGRVWIRAWPFDRWSIFE